MSLRGVVMSARKPPILSKSSLSGLRSRRGGIPAPASERQKSGAQGEEGRFEPGAGFRLSIGEVLAHCGCPPTRDQGPKRGAEAKDVKNEESSGWITENKGVIKVLWMS